MIPIHVETQSPNSINTGIERIKLGRTLLRQNRYAEAEIQSRTGYDILRPQMDVKVSWLVSACQDLVEECRALKRLDEVSKFQAEIAAIAAKPCEPASLKMAPDLGWQPLRIP